MTGKMYRILRPPPNDTSSVPAAGVQDNHLAWMYADIGKRVLIADWNPQANVTSMFLPQEKLEALWHGILITRRNKA